jgi:uncharacterized protein (DUF1330 family)|tara:strand:- start:297 stop:587 length:291 start_codon:yes stop_codon:yes gene_type:complete
MPKGIWLAVYDKIENMETLKKYAVKATPAISKYSGKFLVRGGKNITLEGNQSPRTVIVEFPTFLDAEKCYNSDEYQEALSILKGFVKRNLQIIEGT